MIQSSMGEEFDNIPDNTSSSSSSSQKYNETIKSKCPTKEQNSKAHKIIQIQNQSQAQIQKSPVSKNGNGDGNVNKKQQDDQNRFQQQDTFQLESSQMRNLLKVILLRVRQDEVKEQRNERIKIDFQKWQLIKHSDAKLAQKQGRYVGRLKCVSTKESYLNQARLHNQIGNDSSVRVLANLDLLKPGLAQQLHVPHLASVQNASVLALNKAQMNLTQTASTTSNNLHNNTENTENNDTFQTEKKVKIQQQTTQTLPNFFSKRLQGTPEEKQVQIVNKQMQTEKVFLSDHPPIDPHLFLQQMQTLDDCKNQLSILKQGQEILLLERKTETDNAAKLKLEMEALHLYVEELAKKQALIEEATKTLKTLKEKEHQAKMVEKDIQLPVVDTINPMNIEEQNLCINANDTINKNAIATITNHRFNWDIAQPEPKNQSQAKPTTRKMNQSSTQLNDSEEDSSSKFNQCKSKNDLKKDNNQCGIVAKSRQLKLPLKNTGQTTVQNQGNFNTLKTKPKEQINNHKLAPHVTAQKESRSIKDEMITDTDSGSDEKDLDTLSATQEEMEEIKQVKMPVNNQNNAINMLDNNKNVIAKAVNNENASLKGIQQQINYMVKQKKITEHAEQNLNQKTLKSKQKTQKSNQKTQNSSQKAQNSNQQIQNSNQKTQSLNSTLKMAIEPSQQLHVQPFIEIETLNLAHISDSDDDETKYQKFQCLNDRPSNKSLSIINGTQINSQSVGNLKTSNTSNINLIKQQVERENKIQEINRKFENDKKEFLSKRDQDGQKQKNSQVGLKKIKTVKFDLDTRTIEKEIVKDRLDQEQIEKRERKAGNLHMIKKQQKEDEQIARFLSDNAGELKKSTSSDVFASVHALQSKAEAEKKQTKLAQPVQPVQNNDEEKVEKKQAKQFSPKLNKNLNEQASPKKIKQSKVNKNTNSPQSKSSKSTSQSTSKTGSSKSQSSQSDEEGDKDKEYERLKLIKDAENLNNRADQSKKATPSDQNEEQGKKTTTVETMSRMISFASEIYKIKKKK